MSKSYILAYDFGTSGAKCALVSLQGQLLYAATAGYPLYTDTGEGHAEQDPADYWAAACRTAADVLTGAGIAPEDIAGIAFGTLWKGIIPIDAEGNVLRRSILWLDRRAGAQAQRINEHFGASSYGASDYWPKLLWLREHEPHIIEKAAHILEVNAFLKYKATGQLAVDISNNYVHSFDPKTDAFYERLFAFMDIPREKFPGYVPASRQVGTVTEQAAKELGLVPGIPVFAGNNDIQGVTVGAGRSAIGDVHAYFGSSGWIGFVVPHRQKFTSSPFDTTKDVFMAGMKSVGLSQNWVARNLYAEEYSRLGDDVFRLMDKDVAQICPGAEGVLATSWLYGENPPHADLTMGASFLNLKHYHTRAHMARAMLEGICFHLKQQMLYACRIEDCPVPPVIHAVGGGACSDVWMQILADVLNIPVRVPENPRHAGAVGTACCAMIGLGLWEDYETLAKTLPMGKTFIPDPAAVAVYEKTFAVYEQLYQALKPIYTQL